MIKSWSALSGFQEIHSSIVIWMHAFTHSTNDRHDDLCQETFEQHYVTLLPMRTYSKCRSLNVAFAQSRGIFLQIHIRSLLHKTEHLDINNDNNTLHELDPQTHNCWYCVWGHSNTYLFWRTAVCEDREEAREATVSQKSRPMTFKFTWYLWLRW